MQAQPDNAKQGLCRCHFSGYNALVQCGQRAALIGIDIVQAGQSLTTGLASGFGRFILLRARTIRKMQTATIRKLMTTVMKFP